MKAVRRNGIVQGQIWNSSWRGKESHTTYLPWRKEIWNFNHGNSNVQEEQEGYVHRETHCGQDVETMVNRSWEGAR